MSTPNSENDPDDRRTGARSAGTSDPGRSTDDLSAEVVDVERISSRPGPLHPESARSTEPVRERTREVTTPPAPPARPVQQDVPAVSGRTGRLPSRRDVVAREKEQFGGVKVGSAFFGWLTATGMAVLLTAIVSAAGGAVAVATGTSTTAGVAGATGNAGTVGVVAGIALAVVLFLAYFCGGYVAGRMARFNGAKQGVAVWVWALVVALVVAVAGAIAGNKYDVLGRVNAFPRIPVDRGSLTTGGIVTLVVLAVVALVGAIVGGLSGMRFHRKVDRAGLGV